MDVTNLSITELIQLYSLTIKELKKRKVLRTNNVIGDLGEYLVLDHYDHTSVLPTLNQVPVGTENINAISQDGKRYAIKSTSGHSTGVFYGLEPPESNKPDEQIFEYVIICKFDNDCMLQNIYQLDWHTFIKHKRWHSRMRAWNLSITKALVQDSTVIFSREMQEDQDNQENGDNNSQILSEQKESEDITLISHVGAPDNTTYNKKVVVWEKKQNINHNDVKEKTAHIIAARHEICLEKLSKSRYETDDKMIAVFVLSSSYSVKNKEYWYSIADEILPWLRAYPGYYVAFALGSTDNILEFSREQFENLLQGCLRTREDLTKKKKAHFHFSFAVEGEDKVFFKKKVPEHELIDVSGSLLQGD